MATLTGLRAIIMRSYSLSAAINQLSFQKSTIRFTTQQIAILPQIRCLNYNIKNSKPSDKMVKYDSLAVTKANEHLEVNLYDENDKRLGVMSLADAKKIADSKKLVLMDEKQNPPKVRIMTGLALKDLHMKQKAEKRIAKVIEKQVHFTLKSEDHDLDYKIKQVKEFYEKGFVVSLKIDSKMSANKEDEIKQLQDEMKNKLKKRIDFANFFVRSQLPKEMIINIRRDKEQTEKSKTHQGASNEAENENPVKGAE